MRLLDIVVRWPGSTHDATIFRNSHLTRRFQNGDFGDRLLVGDKGYGIKTSLITPVRTVRTRNQNLFNEAQIRTRNPIERFFGVFKRRFPVLALGIRLKTEKVEEIVVACGVLHNIACMMNDDPPEDINEEVEREIVLAIVEEAEAGGNHRNPNRDNIIREMLINQYFANLL